ncbi:MAG: sulfite exporter TauE/SafE family protein [Armatimonadota bacterium]
MLFPIAGLTLSPAYLVGIGFTVGVCGGFWGVGGGWIATPALYALGLPMNLAVGTDLAHILGHSIISTFRHAKFGNVSFIVAGVMVPGLMVGVEIGARTMQYLTMLGPEAVNSVISFLYVVLLCSLSLFTFVEALRAARCRRGVEKGADVQGEGPVSCEVEDRVTWDIASRLHKLRVPPLVSCKVACIQDVSVWIIVATSLITGIFSGLLGVGGGFIMLPALVYLVGCPTHVAVGTGLLSVVVTGAYGTFTHALKGNVDLLIALMMLLGAVFGTQLGTFATRYVKGAELRALFGVGILAAATAVVLKTYLGLPQVALVVVLVMAGGMSLLIVSYLIGGMMKAARAHRTVSVEGQEGARGS